MAYTQNLAASARRHLQAAESLKATLSDTVISDFVTEMYDMFTDYIYDEVEGLEGFTLGYQLTLVTPL